MNTHPQAIEPSSSLNDPSAARRSRIAMGKAIVSEDTEAIKALLAWDANLASTPVDDHYDETPVMLAAREGKARSLDALLAAGGEALVDSSAPRYDETTPLMAAASRGHAECVRLLLPHSDANAVDLNQETALMHAVSSGPRKPDANYAQCVDLLLPVSDANLTDWAGNNALAFAAARGSAGCVEQLLAVDGGALARTSNSTGWTPLMHAACNERVGAGLALPHSDLDATIVKLLLPHSDLDATIAKHDARGGNSALMLAARSQRPDLIEALLAVGADASIADEEGWTALHLAAGAWPLAVQENAECVKLLLADSDTAAATKGSDPFSQGVHTEGGETPLEIAAISGNHEAVRLLLPVSDARHTAACGRTALMMAAELGLTDIVKTLLPFSDPLMIDARGESAFAIAAGIGHFECADALSRHSNALEVAKVFKKVGSEKLPGWAKHLAAQERKEIAAVVAQAEAAQARSAVATATPKAPTNKPSGRSMRL